MVGDDRSLERREVLGALVLDERGSQDVRLLAVRRGPGEQVDRARELAPAEDLARERIDQPPHRRERDARSFGRALRSRLCTQHRDDVPDVEG